MRTLIRVGGICKIEGRILLESLADRDVWGIPGGSLEADEAIEDGCRREFREELGWEVQCVSLAMVMEHFWQDSGEYFREYGFYFRVEPQCLHEVNPENVQSREEHLKFSCFALEDLASLTMVPPQLRGILPNRRVRDGF